MRNLTELARERRFNRGMAYSITVTFVLIVSVLVAVRDGRRHNDLITPRPYNNQHSDATAARDERAMLG